MRRYVLHYHGVHRHACLALYRATLRAAKASPLLSKSKIIEQLGVHFHRDARLQSYDKARAALDQGYEALSLLQQSNTATEPALTSLGSSLDALVPHLRPRPPKRSSRDTPNRPRTWAVPGVPKLLDRQWPRPLSEIPSGRRYVPRLTSACNFPILRLGPRQSTYLSRVIRTKIEARQRSQDLEQELDRQDELAEEEDRWDHSINLQLHDLVEARALKKQEDLWDKATKTALETLRAEVGQKTQRETAMTRRMWEIEQAEQAMADKELQQRRAERKAVREARAAERSRIAAA